MCETGKHKTTRVQFSALSPMDQLDRLIETTFSYCAFYTYLSPGIATSGSYLYVTNINADTVTKCTINMATGGLSSCGTTGTVGDGPYAITIYMDKFAYVANSNTVTVTRCTIDTSNGALTNCGDSGYNMGNRIFYTEATGDYVFLSAFSNNIVYRCGIIPSTGQLTGCGAVGSPYGFSGPMGVTVG